MTQTAGFVMNGKDDTDLDVEIYVNHGWESLQIYTEISPGKSYQTYVKMVKGEGGLFHGDTIMLDGDEIVAFFKGVAVSDFFR
jgi:noranthrone synthase